MTDWLGLESKLHWGFFAAGFLVVAPWETYWPLRALLVSNARRWALHVGLTALGHAAALLTPVTATMTAVGATQFPFGLLNHGNIPLAVKIVVSVLVLDCFRWAQHYSFHRIGWLWRIHQVHHSDPDYDLTTTLRFHPLESLLMQGSYLGIIFLLAPPPAVALGLELSLLVQNFFGHANASLPSRWERWLRRVVVTPDLHRIHHSQSIEEQNRNFGVMFPWWDRLFGTYKAEPELGRTEMLIGLAGFDHGRSLSLPGLLLMPFRKRAR